MSKTDLDHLAAIVKGEAYGLERIYQLFFARIVHFVQRNGGTMHDAQDLFQDALLLVYEKGQEKNFVLSCSFYSFLYGICRKLWSNRLQKKNNRTRLLDTYQIEEMIPIDELIEKEEERHLFRAAFDTLGKDCKKLLSLFFDKLKMVDIQKAMGFSSVSYTSKRKFQCKEKLLQHIKEQPTYEELTSL